MLVTFRNILLPGMNVIGAVHDLAGDRAIADTTGGALGAQRARQDAEPPGCFDFSEERSDRGFAHWFTPVLAAVARYIDLVADRDP